MLIVLRILRISGRLSGGFRIQPVFLTGGLGRFLLRRIVCAGNKLFGSIQPIPHMLRGFFHPHANTGSQELYRQKNGHDRQQKYQSAPQGIHRQGQHRQQRKNQHIDSRRRSQSEPDLPAGQGQRRQKRNDLAAAQVCKQENTGRCRHQQAQCQNRAGRVRNLKIIVGIGIDRLTGRKHQIAQALQAFSGRLEGQKQHCRKQWHTDNGECCFPRFCPLTFLKIKL